MSGETAERRQERIEDYLEEIEALKFDISRRLKRIRYLRVEIGQLREDLATENAPGRDFLS